MISTDNVIPFNRPDPEPAGFAQTSKAWLSRWSTDRRLTSGEKQICLFIYLHFNSEYFKETGGDLLAWPSWQSLMDATGLSRPSVHRCLRKLKELGAFEIKRGPYDHQNKKRGNNRYIATTGKVHADGPSGGELGLTSDQSKVSPVLTRRGESIGEYRSGESQSKVSPMRPNSKDGNPRGPKAPEEEKPSTTSPGPSPQPAACEVPRPQGGWRDRLDEPPLLTGEERRALGRLAALANANGSGATTVPS
jgi:hypothetical protein